MADNDSKRPRSEFVWRGLGLHVGTRRRPTVTLEADQIYPHLFRIRYPNGWLSTPANLSRAKDAAYGHARYVLTLGRNGAAHTGGTGGGHQ